MANLSEEARRRRFVGWMQVWMGGFELAAAQVLGVGGREAGLLACALRLVSLSTCRVLQHLGLQQRCGQQAASMEAWEQPAFKCTARFNRLRSLPALLMQRRGHAWADIRGLLHTLEKEDSRRALDED